MDVYIHTYIHTLYIPVYLGVPGGEGVYGTVTGTISCRRPRLESTFSLFRSKRSGRPNRGLLAIAFWRAEKRCWDAVVRERLRTAASASRGHVPDHHHPVFTSADERRALLLIPRRGEEVCRISDVTITITRDPFNDLGGGGGGGCNNFVSVLGGNGTKIVPTGDIFDQPPGQMR